MRIETKLGPVEGSVDEVLLLLQRMNGEAPKEASVADKPVRRLKSEPPKKSYLYGAKKWTAEEEAYVRENYAHKTSAQIARGLKKHFGVKRTPAAIGVRASVIGATRPKAELVKPVVSLSASKNCRSCGRLIRRKKGMGEAAWNRWTRCGECVTGAIKAGIQKAKASSDPEPEFPHFTQANCGLKVLMDFFYDMIANKKTVGKEVWAGLGIRNEHHWERFIRETLNNGPGLAAYFAMTDRFRTHTKADGSQLLIYGDGK